MMMIPKWGNYPGDGGGGITLVIDRRHVGCDFGDPVIDPRDGLQQIFLGNSQRAYADYLEEHKKIDRLWKIFQSIDDFASDAEAAE